MSLFSTRSLGRYSGILVGIAAFFVLLVSPAAAFNYVYTSNGATWGVQDAAAPRVDTGSVRDTSGNALRGFGGIRVDVSTDPLRDGNLIRGFGLRFDPPNRFVSTKAVDLGGVAIWRKLFFNYSGNWGRWLDFYKNTTDEPIEVESIFGGQTGIGNSSGSTDSHVATTSSGDDQVTADDSWLVRRVGTDPAVSSQGPSGVVLGSPAPFDGAISRTANFLKDPFSEAPAASGHESNFVGYQNSFTLDPGETVTIAHFVAIGVAESSSGTGTTAPGAQVDAVTEEVEDLAQAPAFGEMPKPEICALINWDVESLDVAAFDAATDCPEIADPTGPAVPPANPTTTGSPYDVVGKTIADLRADMESGETTSQEITRAYLDRIAAYDVGAFGFNAYTYVARDALLQAKAADERRAGGFTSPVLGIPVAVKDLYDTKDMPTTNGSLVFEGFQSEEDATQVKLLRDAGAVILGKAATEEYAQSGQYADSAYGQVWNAFDTSKSSIASSGGPAVATAADLAAVSLGSQTGDSLYGPASAASLWTLRGTDGIASSYGVWPLSWLQDFPGTIAKSASDLTDMLNVTTGTDPLDPITVEADADANRPENWRTSLDPNALQGKRIGYYPSAFVDPFGTSGTVDVQREALEYFEEAGATLVEITGGPSLPSSSGLGDRNYTGWQFWIDAHPNSPYSDPREIITSEKRLPYRRSNGYTGTGMMTETQIQAYKDFRANAKVAVADWMDNPPSPTDPDTALPSPGALDAVAFPGLKSVISLNDGGSSAFGRGDPPTNSAGAPSVAFPAGVNDHGEPTNLQLVGRAWDDPDLIAYAYAFDQVANGQIHTDSAPALPYVEDPTPPVIEPPVIIPPEPEPPVAGTPQVTLRTHPWMRRVGTRRKFVTYTVRLKNSGDSGSGAITLCANVPKRKLRVLGKRCVKLGLPAGGSNSRKFKLRIKAPARGKLTSIQFRATGPQIVTRKTRVGLIVRKR